MEIVTVLVINFYITGMRTSVRVFKDAHGLYWYDRYKPLVESVINIAVSILLANRFGVIGIFLGTMISTITTSFWVEPFVLYKYGFKSSSRGYFKQYFKYELITIGVGLMTWFSCSFIGNTGILNFMIKVVICGVVPNLLFFLLFRNDKNFTYLILVSKRELRNKAMKNVK